MENLQLSRVLIVALALIVVAVSSDQTFSAAPQALNQALPGCNSTCGSVAVPYPFGIGYSATPDQRPCFLEINFNLTCNNSVLYWYNAETSGIDVLAHQMDVSFYVSRYCNDSEYNNPTLRTGVFSVSRTENKLLTVGYNSVGALDSFYDNKTYTTGCLTACYGNDLVIDDGTCSGIGCCQVDIPPRMRDITLTTSTIPNVTRNSSNDCSYSFIVKDGFYNFSRSHLRTFPNTSLPLVIDWTVGDQDCSTAASMSGYACKDNSHCNDTNSDYGYRCICNPGYLGNPYIGCTDIDECKTGSHTCASEKYCLNTDGSYRCFCPKGHSGNGTLGIGCNKRDVVTKVVVGVGTGIVILFVGTTSLYLIYQRRKLIKLREKHFKQNGGSILLQKLARENSSHMVQIFTEEQLNKATNNFDESLIIGRGGFGTVFKGHLADNRIVAVKKSKIVDTSQKEQFANEVIILSQINHRNVVKLLGCCLETEVPLLVYDFVNNGTLFDFIHSERKVNNETWKKRIRIAAEAAGALSYLHSEASVPIIHRDVKTANILLDDTYTAKVSDFGASRLIPLDQTELATMVQGTFGYLDPEYMLTSQLTDKSDVYSFGVVLIELLSGEKPHTFSRPEDKRSLANHFLTCFKEDRLIDVLQDGIANEENIKEITEVAILAAKCLRLDGDERPSMKEVAMVLDTIRKMDNHPLINTNKNLEEAQYLLHDAPSSIYEHGNSSSHQYGGYDSIGDHVPIALDNGR